MKRYFCCIVWVCIAWNVQLFGNAGKDELRERIYVQTDKQLYLAGEPILLKFLTTDAEQFPIIFSKVAYAELVDNFISRLQIMVELTNGTGSGLMQLPADIPTGYYRLIAYTQYMRNEGVDVFFEKNIAVMNTFQSGYQPMENEELEEPEKISETGKQVNSFSSDSYGGLSLQTDNMTYSPRARGEIIVEGLPENIHTLSVTIAGKDFLHNDESNASLFQKNMTKKSTAFSGDFLPEYEGHIITGKLVNNQTEPDQEDLLQKNGNVPAFYATGISFPTADGIRFFRGQETETEDIRFLTTGISGTKEIATVVYHADDKYRVDIQTPYITRYQSRQMPVLQIDSVYYEQLLKRSVALQVFRYFSDDLSVKKNILEPHFKMKPTWNYLLDEYTRFTTMREVFIEFITGARFRRNAGKQEISVLSKRGNILTYGVSPLVLLDGVPIVDHDAVYNYDPLSVEQINIYYGPCLLGGYLFDGIVELITYRRMHADLNLNKSSQIIAYESPQPFSLWYTPDYSNEKTRQNRLPDGRHTLAWEPDVKTNGKKTISIPFFTSDLTGEFQATVEGITNDGQFIFVTSVFMVE